MVKEKKWLVYAEDILNAIRDDPSISGSNFARVRTHINEAPTVDAVEVVHGRWAISRESEISKSVWCTACGEGFYLHKKNTVPIDKMPYCPNCGAKMDGDGNGN